VSSPESGKKQPEDAHLKGYRKARGKDIRQGSQNLPLKGDADRADRIEPRMSKRKEKPAEKKEARPLGTIFTGKPWNAEDREKKMLLKGDYHGSKKKETLHGDLGNVNCEEGGLKKKKG